ncbi:hypothetical protein BN961_03290 [Afipia felis]|uniref:GIY-YIG domain-containing protein n=1 Tax=Afipia felis TaxID=1035 RepID=A0A090N8B7_AFIFE|nr:GIY-YIG nuclease family protein [Afipia felis]CEG09858.1 hypothetical protein BN961_03290 [Afipia felis]
MSSVCQPAFDAGTTTIIHRPQSAITGFRRITDEASPLAVWSFPFASLNEELRERLAAPACYVLSDGNQVYIGETGNMTRRLTEHLTDPGKRCFREVFAVTGVAHRPYDKSGPLYLQQWLTRRAEIAGFVTVRKDKNPPLTEPADWRKSTLDRIIVDAERLLFDAGCRAFHANSDARSLLPPLTLSAPAAHENTAQDQSDLMHIGVAGMPPMAAEYELNYCGVWARGSSLGDDFVVAAGSEVRASVNPSARPIVTTRHAMLKDASALMPIRGVEDRLRLTVAVAFRSLNIAAQVVCGTQASARLWRPINQTSPLIAS